MKKYKAPDTLSDDALNDVVGGGYPDLVMKRGVIRGFAQNSVVLQFDEADAFLGKRAGVIFESNDEA